MFPACRTQLCRAGVITTYSITPDQAYLIRRNSMCQVTDHTPDLSKAFFSLQEHPTFF